MPPSVIFQSPFSGPSILQPFSHQNFAPVSNNGISSSVSVSKDFCAMGSASTCQTGPFAGHGIRLQRRYSVCSRPTPSQAHPLTSKSLLDPRTQESFYNKIVNRYMAFCSRHSKTLDDAFASLRIKHETLTVEPSSPGLKDTSTARGMPATLNVSSDMIPDSRGERASPLSDPEPSAELSVILLALRKLREAMLASHAARLSAEFDQRVHVFNVRLAVLAYHPPSYHPALLHLLSTLSKDHPLVATELSEMVTFFILDLACRQDNLAEALAVQSRSRTAFGYNNPEVARILAALATNDWVLFWRVRRKVDGYARAILHWKIATLRKIYLTALARSYMTCDVGWILSSSTGSEMSWEDLIQREDVGWLREGSKITIRKPKLKDADPPKIAHESVGVGQKS